MKEAGQAYVSRLWIIRPASSHYFLASLTVSPEQGLWGYMAFWRSVVPAWLTSARVSKVPGGRSSYVGASLLQEKNMD